MSGGGIEVETYNLRHVQDDNGRLETDTNTGNETTSDDASEGITMTSDHLNNNTKAVDDATSNDSPLAADAVSDITGDDSTEEGTAGENRDDQRLVAFAERVMVKALDLVDEVLGTIDTVDVPRIVTEEDATERGEGAHKVGLPGYGSLDLVDIVGSLEGDRVVASALIALGFVDTHDEDVASWLQRRLQRWGGEHSICFGSVVGGSETLKLCADQRPTLLDNESEKEERPQV